MKQPAAQDSAGKTAAPERENGLGKVVAGASAKARDLASRTQETLLRAADRNGDGKLDWEDLGLSEERIQEAGERAKDLAASAGRTIATGGKMLGKAIGEAKAELDRKSLRPVFLEDFSPALPALIRIVEEDRRRSESEVCAGAVGYLDDIKGVKLLNLYEGSAHLLGLEFYPGIFQTIYHVNPFQRNLYICLDDYFTYLKKARVSELERIAQDLGAKRVRITFQEHRKTLVGKKGTGNAEAQALLDTVADVKGSVTYNRTDQTYDGIEIAADVAFSGQEVPVIPTVVYFKSESDIEKLIQMRTGESQNRVQSKTYRFQCSNSSGISEREAGQIDALLRQIKCSGSASISSEAQRESRTDMEYHIEF